MIKLISKYLVSLFLGLTGIIIFFTSEQSLAFGSEQYLPQTFLNVSQPLAQTQNLIVSPASVSIKAGAKQSFTVSRGLAPFSFSATAGTMTTSGSRSAIYQAPKTAGRATVTVKDARGRLGTAQVTIVAAPIVDTTAPVVSFFQVPSISTTNTVNQFGFSATDAGGSDLKQILCSLDGAAFSVCVSPTSVTTAVGSHIFMVKASDNANNVSSVISYSFMVTAAPVVPMPNFMPMIDMTKIPAPAVGYSEARVMPVPSGAYSGSPVTSDYCNRASPLYNNFICTFNGIVSGIGAFRVPCDTSHMSKDDPIVFPGQPGRAHLHTFFGNTGVNAYSTADSIANSGNSTCAGGILDRSGYWVPSMIDTKGGTPLSPTSNNVYYKSGYSLPNSGAAMNVMPNGLRMLSHSVRYICYGPNGQNPGWKSNIAQAYADGTCLVGGDFVMEVSFPQCWDGVNLDSADHMSHMVDTEGYQLANGSWSSRCPANHPVALPTVSYNIHYAITDNLAVSRWVLSSDNATLPAGSSGHGDFFMGWDSKTIQTFTRYCENMSLDCHDYLLGDGTMLY